MEAMVSRKDTYERARGRARVWLRSVGLWHSGERQGWSRSYNSSGKEEAGNRQENHIYTAEYGKRVGLTGWQPTYCLCEEEWMISTQEKGQIFSPLLEHRTRRELSTSMRLYTKKFRNFRRCGKVLMVPDTPFLLTRQQYAGCIYRYTRTRTWQPHTLGGLTPPRYAS